jgi:hypothetical protein
MQLIFLNHYCRNLNPGLGAGYLQRPERSHIEGSGEEDEVIAQWSRYSLGLRLPTNVAEESLFAREENILSVSPGIRMSTV